MILLPPNAGFVAAEEVVEDGATIARVSLHGPVIVLVAGHDVFVLDVDTTSFRDSMLVRQEHRGKVLMGLLARALRSRDDVLYRECKEMADYIRGAEVKEKYLSAWEQAVARCTERRATMDVVDEPGRVWNAPLTKKEAAIIAKLNIVDATARDISAGEMWWANDPNGAPLSRRDRQQVEIVAHRLLIKMRNSAR